MCSYTSSVMTHTSYFSARRAIVSSSARVKTRPQGLEGLHRMSAFTPSCAMAASSTVSSKVNVGGTSGT